MSTSFHSKLFSGDDAYSIDGIKYKLTPSDAWDKVEDGGGRPMEPIEFRGANEEFTLNITDEEIESLKDSKGEIRYEKVFDLCLPRFGENDEQTLYQFQAARMRNYMRRRIIEDGWTPNYYTGDKVITADHVARYYGSCLGKMLYGN